MSFGGDGVETGRYIEGEGCAYVVVETNVCLGTRKQKEDTFVLILSRQLTSILPAASTRQRGFNMSKYA